MRGATWCYTKCGSRWTEARACTLLLNNVEGKLCLDRKLRCSTWRGSGRGGEREVPARARRREDYVFDRTSRSALWRDRDLVSNFSAGVQHAVDFAALTVCAQLRRPFERLQAGGRRRGHPQLRSRSSTRRSRSSEWLMEEHQKLVSGFSAVAAGVLGCCLSAAPLPVSTVSLASIAKMIGE